MVDDPYRVLGIPSTANQDEIKKAYRKKAKEYHPDLHPNDPNAAKKMNEVNEAYDMLMNPEKYTNRRTGSGQSNSGTGHQGSGSGQHTSSSRGSGGWSSDFGGFGFEDIFGFGFQEDDVNATRPQPEATDSSDIRRAIYEINRGQYQAAIDILTYIRSTLRDSRWYYLSSIANHGIGNSVTAIDHMQKAVQLDPNNRTYQNALRQFKKAEQTYENNAHGFDTEALARMQRICFGLMAAQCICGPLGFLRCIR